MLGKGGIMERVKKYRIGDTEAVLFWSVEEGEEVLYQEFRLIGTRQYFLPGEREEMEEKKEEHAL